MTAPTPPRVSVRICGWCNWVAPMDCTCHPDNPVEVEEGAENRLQVALARAADTDAWKRQGRAT